jgi:hypothetical protein
VGHDLAAVLDAAMQHALRAHARLRDGAGGADDGAVHEALSGIVAMLGLAVGAAPTEWRSDLADGRAKVAALLLAADQLEELVGEPHARPLRVRAAAEGVSVAARYLRAVDTSVAV